MAPFRERPVRDIFLKLALKAKRLGIQKKHQIIKVL